MEALTCNDDQGDDALPTHSLVISRRAVRLFTGLCVALLATAALAATVLAANGTLTRSLVRAGEEPGFTIAKRQTHLSLKEYLRGDPHARADAKRLKAAGFQTAAFELLKGAHKAQAGSAVVEFKTSAGARKLTASQLAAVHKQGAGTYTTIKVPGVPRASGYAFTASARNGGAKFRDANVYWVQGRCSLFVGDLRPGSGALAMPVIAAVKAVHRRTGGTCP